MASKVFFLLLVSFAVVSCDSSGSHDDDYFEYQPCHSKCPSDDAVNECCKDLGYATGYCKLSGRAECEGRRSYGRGYLDGTGGRVPMNGGGQPGAGAAGRRTGGVRHGGAASTASEYARAKEVVRMVEAARAATGGRAGSPSRSSAGNRGTAQGADWQGGAGRARRSFE